MSESGLEQFVLVLPIKKNFLLAVNEFEIVFLKKANIWVKISLLYHEIKSFGDFLKSCLVEKIDSLKLTKTFGYFQSKVENKELHIENEKNNFFLKIKLESNPFLDFCNSFRKLLPIICNPNNKQIQMFELLIDVDLTEKKSFIEWDLISKSKGLELNSWFFYNGHNEIICLWSFLNSYLK